MYNLENVALPSLTGYVKANILPVIVTNHTVTIAAELVSLMLEPA